MGILPQGTDTDPDRPDPYRYALDAHPDPDQDPDSAKQCGSDPIRIRYHSTAFYPKIVIFFFKNFHLTRPDLIYPKIFKPSRA
jgi:hypothetical protein